jgi:hypothetical protein
MKPRIWCVCAIGMFLVSTTSFADSHFEDTYGSGNVSSQDPCIDHYATGHAEGDDPWGVGYGTGSHSEVKETAGWAEPTIYVDINAEAWLFLSLNFQACYAQADGEGYGYARGVTGGVEAYAYVDFTMFQGKYSLDDEDYPDPFADWADMDWYEADETIEVSHTALASAGVIQNSSDVGGSSLGAYANGWWY